jgi:hypothetical protein
MFATTFYRALFERVNVAGTAARRDLASAA